MGSKDWPCCAARRALRMGAPRKLRLNWATLVAICSQTSCRWALMASLSARMALYSSSLIVFFTLRVLGMSAVEMLSVTS